MGKTITKYVDHDILDRAKRSIRIEGEPFVAQVNNSISIRFGIVILIASKSENGKIYHKKLAHWMMMSPSEINDELNTQKWSK